MKNNILLTVNSDSDFNYDVYGYIIGIDSLSVNFSKYFNVSDIINILNKINNKKLFISLNRLIFNNDLNKIEKFLVSISKYNIAGIFISDVGIINIIKRLKLDIKIILNQDNLITNYKTINWYKNRNINDIVISNEITYKDINIIRKSADTILYKKIFGYIKLSTSKRKFITSYFENFNIKSDIKKAYIKNTNKYIILEDYFGTYIFSDKVMFLNNELNYFSCNYYIIDTFLINNNLSTLIINYYNNNFDKEIEKKINSIIETSKYFIDTNTIFKVKL